MYFSLPTSQERLQHQQQLLQQQQQQQRQQQQGQPQSTLSTQSVVDPLPMTSAPQATTTLPATKMDPSAASPPNMNYLTDERLVEIVENLEDHWRSPPILTPTTLAMIFNNSYGDIGSPFPPSRPTPSTTSTASSEKDVISTASLQCFLSQLQKTAALYLPPLEKVIKEDAILGDLRDGNTSIPPLGALDHLTQVLATFNQTPSSSSSSST